MGVVVVVVAAVVVAGAVPTSWCCTRPWPGLIDESGSASELAGDLERGGLIDIQTVRRLACDASIVVAVDDDVGHSMYEGRTRRTPTPTQRREAWRRDRCCRFPGCANSAFADVHHLKWWKRDAVRRTFRICACSAITTMT